MIRYIYTFFVGLFLAIFVGLGIAVFYQAPMPPQAPAALSYPSKDGPTASEQRDIDAYNKKQQAYDKATQQYDRNVSLAILACAVVLLAIALLAPNKLQVIADGILLGGIFTLLYGIGRGLTVDSNKYRFLVATIGLMVTLALGYVKFGHQQLVTKK